MNIAGGNQDGVVEVDTRMSPSPSNIPQDSQFSEEEDTDSGSDNE